MSNCNGTLRGLCCSERTGSSHVYCQSLQTIQAMSTQGELKLLVIQRSNLHACLQQQASGHTKHTSASCSLPMPLPISQEGHKLLVCMYGTCWSTAPKFQDAVPKTVPFLLSEGRIERQWYLQLPPFLPSWYKMSVTTPECWPTLCKEYTESLWWWDTFVSR